MWIKIIQNAIQIEYLHGTKLIDLDRNPGDAFIVQYNKERNTGVHCTAIVVWSRNHNQPNIWIQNMGQNVSNQIAIKIVIQIILLVVNRVMILRAKQQSRALHDINLSRLWYEMILRICTTQCQCLNLHFQACIHKPCTPRVIHFNYVFIAILGTTWLAIKLQDTVTLFCSWQTTMIKDVKISRSQEND